MRTSAVIVCAVLLIGVAAPLSAHHAFTSEFDSAQPIQLRGVLVRAELINPHSWFHIDVEEEDGTLTRWMIEGGTPNTLFRNGITRNSLPEGIEILVDGYRSRDGSNRANGRDMTFSDGRKIFLGGPPTVPR